MHSSLINCFNKVIILRFCNELVFHILSRDGKMFGLSPGIKISISSKSGHSTFVQSTIDSIMWFSRTGIPEFETNFYILDHKIPNPNPGKPRLK